MLTLTNAHGLSVTLLELGGIIQSIRTPDRNGRLGDIVLGYDRESDYPGYSFFGAMAGRYANRLGGAAFPLNGTVFHVTPNEGPNCLHGGSGIHTKQWRLTRTDKGAQLFLLSPDGADGFPGNLRITVDVTLDDEDALTLAYHAVCDRDTVLNLTNHSYFNLAGSGDILSHELRLDADAYLEVDRALIPTGRLVDVTGTDFDFRSRRPIASGKYDHCFVLRKGDGVKAEAWDPASGRGLRMETDLPGVQLYCGAGVRGVAGKGGVTYPAFGGFCLETQQYPDAPNHPEFPSALLRAGEEFRSRTCFRFFAE